MILEGIVKALGQIVNGDSPVCCEYEEVAGSLTEGSDCCWEPTVSAGEARLVSTPHSPLTSFPKAASLVRFNPGE
jgi:hypothetical protein